MNQGLSNKEAERKLSEEGFNELPSAASKNILKIALEVMKEPMFLLLITCGLLYIIIGEHSEGFTLLSAIFLIIGITFYQYQKTERALDALKNLSSPRALVLREGKEERIAGREVVNGDILIISEGDRIAADAELIKSVNLTVDESILTGESLPVLKNSEDQKTKNIYSGTLVVQGHGYAKVTATGPRTEFGKIGISLSSIKQDETRLQKDMKSLITRLFIIAVFISVIVVLAFYLTQGDFVKSLLSGLAAAMAILPEEFPVVMTIFLALGAWRLSKKNVLTRKPTAIETLGSATVLCSDKTGTITQNKMEVVSLWDGFNLFTKTNFQKENLNTILKTASLACQEGSADPMEHAISNTVPISQTAVLVKEYPLTKNVLAITRVVKLHDSTMYIATKGAPETIMNMCGLSNEEKQIHSEALNKLGEQGYRVLGVAGSSELPEYLPQEQTDLKLKFLGLLALQDPVRPEVPDAIKECRSAGIKVMMITGDFPATAKSIGTQIGLTGDVISGNELNKLSDEELKLKLKHVSIFARVIPEQKLRIVELLKANKEVVAMTGDGVNDAPALKAAHIGVAMGKKGTDVAREASSLVLLDDNFASIVGAIRSGRRIFDNLQKAMSYIIAIHIPIIGLTLLPAFISSLPVLLMPLHIVFMELIIDPVCSVVFESQSEEAEIMNRPPRNPDENFFGSSQILIGVVKGLIVLSMVIIIFMLSIYEGHTDGEVRAIAFSALIIGNVFLILSSLSKTRDIIKVISEKNTTVWLIVPLALFVLTIIINIPVLRNLFSFEFPGHLHFVSSLIGAVCVLLIFEAWKYFNSKRERRR